MPVIFPVVKSALSDAIRKVIAAPSRYFATLDPVLNSYYELDTAFQPSGDFVVEVDVSTPGIVSGQATLLSGSTQSTNVIILDMQSSGTVRFFAYVGNSIQTIITSTSTIDDSQLHTIKVTYTGTTAELFIDGVSEGSATWALNGSQNIVNIGRRIGLGNYFDGITANVKLTDLATSSNSRIFPLALGPGSSVENSTINSGSVTYTNIPDANREKFTFDDANQGWVGEELVTQAVWESPFSVGSQWTYNAGTGEWGYVGDGSLNVLQLLSSSAQPSTYLLDVTVERTSGTGSFALTNASTIDDDTIDDAEFLATNPYQTIAAFNDLQFFKRRSGTLSVSVSKPSLKKLLELP